VARRVLQQVVQHDPQSLSRAADLQVLVTGDELHGEAAVRGADPLHRGVGHIREVDWLGRRKGRVPAGQRLQRVQQPHEAVLLPRHIGQDAGAFSGRQVGVACQRVQVRPHAGQRCAQLVARVGGEAAAAAGDGDVMVHGAGAAQALLRAGQLDELELHVVPVLLGQGRRLFDNLPAEHIELDLVRRLTTPEVEELAQHVTHLRYRVCRP
jgi:hypothetical protein